MNITNEELMAAMQVAAEKMVADGMTAEGAQAYINANLETILAWCFKLIAAGRTK